MIPRRRAKTSTWDLSRIVTCVATGATEDNGLVERFEHAIAKTLGVGSAVALNSGRSSMASILKHIGTAPGDEIIIPAYTLSALLPIIHGLGATAIPADIDRSTLNLSPVAVQARIGMRTKAIIALHAFGSPCDIEAIAELARTYKLLLIEDCAHSLGATVNGQQTGSFGDAAFFSFEPHKPVNTFGGGMAVSDDPALVSAIRHDTAGFNADVRPLLKKIKAVRTEQRIFDSGLAMPLLFLAANPLTARILNRTYRLVQSVPRTDLRYLAVQAELGLDSLKSLEQRLEKRRHMAAVYRSSLDPRIELQSVRDGCNPTWYFAVAILPNAAAAARRRMLLRGIDVGAGNEIADDCAAVLGFNDCPNAADICRRAIALPMFDGIREESVRRVAQTLNSLV